MAGLLKKRSIPHRPELKAKMASSEKDSHRLMQGARISGDHALAFANTRNDIKQSPGQRPAGKENPNTPLPEETPLRNGAWTAAG